MEQVFDASCNFGGCHAAPGAGELVLEDGQAYGNLVSVSAAQPMAAAAGLVRVDPGRIETSFLAQKITGTQASGHGDAMPAGTDGLDAARVAVIERWILAGAAAQ